MKYAWITQHQYLNQAGLWNVVAGRLNAVESSALGENYQAKTVSDFDQSPLITSVIATQYYDTGE
jgi:hypothetical protein